jgi:hypothetical protein
MICADCSIGEGARVHVTAVLHPLVRLETTPIPDSAVSPACEATDGCVGHTTTAMAALSVGTEGTPASVSASTPAFTSASISTSVGARCMIEERCVLRNSSVGADCLVEVGTILDNVSVCYVYCIFMCAVCIVYVSMYLCINVLQTLCILPGCDSYPRKRECAEC